MYTVIDNCHSINLDAHALIEASAGTGKTYTIENLVVRFLKEKKEIELENILLVTFTEKAACELKLRIRRKIESELSDCMQKYDFSGPEIGTKLKNTLDTFDTASIFTIHSFCQSILRDFAFENNSPLFPAELVNDESLYESLLKEQMRKEWHERYRDDLPEILEISEFSSKKSGFLKTIVEIARQVYRLSAGDILRPDAGEKTFRELGEELKKLVFAMKALIGKPGEFSKGFEELNINGNTKKSLKKKIIAPLENYLAEVSEDRFDSSKFSDLMKMIQNAESSDRQGLECLIFEKWTKKGPNPRVCPNLQTIREKLDEAADILESQKHLLAIRTIRQLQADVRQAKQNRGCISFDDMLTLVEESLHGERSPLLLQKLREKYKVAFVDEFQDTDPVQWQIFRKIFLTNPDDLSENLLFLIGDPKQAIYAFRGADVHTYLDAKNEIEELTRSKQANLYSLAENWRSESELINHFNRLFSGSAWFSEEAGSSKIGYQAVRYPEGKERPESIVEDNSVRPVLTLIDLSEYATSAPAKQHLAEFIAREILYLTKKCRIRLKKKDEPERSLDFGDMCILVRGKTEVPFIEKALLNLNIPYSYYRKPGLFFSDEAFYLSCVFHAILDPGNLSEVKKALLTPFFQFSLPALYAYNSLPLSHPVKQLLRQWNEYALCRKWSFLFQSLIEESGLLFRESEKKDWDRIASDYRQLFEYLSDAAYRKNLDFRGLCALLDSHRKQTVPEDGEADIHQIETEARKVQIMTVHVSKGLQFPVVFLAGGITRSSRKKDRLIYHESGRKVIDLSFRKGKEKNDEEEKEEVKRLYYVALTRAQCKLYLPFYPFKGREAWAGPVSYLLSPALDAAFLENRTETVLRLKPEQNRDNMSPMSSNEEITEAYPFPEPLFPKPGDHRHKRIRIESFSGLHQNRAYPAQEEGFHPVREAAKEDDESYLSGSVSENEGEDIPGGAEVGSMFHAVLERIDFQSVEKDEAGIREEIGRQTEIFRIDEKWKDRIYEIVRKTLTAPIPFVADGFTLSCLKKEDRIHEAEFYYPFCGNHHSQRFGDEIFAAGCDIQNGYIRGYIDLIFRYHEKYYIADWKSNRIDEGYHYEALKNNMDQADYHLQYKIYTIAVLRWLRQSMGNRFNPDIHFGGVFYFYLRGMGKGGDNGIYYVSPRARELGCIEDIEEEIGKILRERLKNRAF